MRFKVEDVPRSRAKSKAVTRYLKDNRVRLKERVGKHLSYTDREREIKRLGAAEFNQLGPEQQQMWIQRAFAQRAASPEQGSLAAASEQDSFAADGSNNQCESGSKIRVSKRRLIEFGTMLLHYAEKGKMTISDADAHSLALDIVSKTFHAGKVKSERLRRFYGVKKKISKPRAVKVGCNKKPGRPPNCPDEVLKQRLLEV